MTQYGLTEIRMREKELHFNAVIDEKSQEPLVIICDITSHDGKFETVIFERKVLSK